MLFRLRFLCVLFVATLMLSHAAFSQKELFKGLDGYIAKSMKEWETPGLAIAVVRNDSVVFMKGYGVSKMGEPAPVTPRTIFAIASTTKAMTAACLGMLVDEGKMKWDDPVAKFLPWFQLYDPYVTRELTVRDLLCHRSGLSRGDNLWYLSSFTREEVLRRVRYLKPSWSFRSRYGYQNIMFLAAGELIPSVASMSWDDFIAQRLFKPLGMTRSNTSVRFLTGLDDVATPHDKVDEVMQPIRWPNFDNVGSAGSVNSCVEDMAQWVRMNLGRGTYRGTKVLSPEVIKEIQTPQTIVRLDSLEQAMRPSTHFSTYGFGWGLRDYLGRKIIMHTGSLDGMRARVALIPEENLGFVILMNSSRTPLHEAVAYRIIDHYLKGPERDWSAELLKITKEQEEKGRAERKKKSDSRATDTKPSLPLESYAGTYQDEMYGEVTVKVEDGKLMFSYHPLYVGPMTHWQYDTFEVVWNDRTFGKDLISFVLGSDGKVVELRWEDFTEFRKVK